MTDAVLVYRKDDRCRLSDYHWTRYGFPVPTNRLERVGWISQVQQRGLDTVYYFTYYHRGNVHHRQSESTILVDAADLEPMP